MSNPFGKFEVVTVDTLAPFVLDISGNSNVSNLIYDSSGAEIIVAGVNVGQTATVGVQS